MLKIFAFIGYLSLSSNFSDYNSLNPEHLYCVARAVYSEARGEDFEGQAAVAWGIKNRVQSKEFPNNPCDVIYQIENGVVQFPGIKEVKIDYEGPLWDKAVSVAVLSWIGYIDDPIGGMRFWYAHNKVAKPGGREITVVKVVGNHTYYDYFSGS